MRVASKRAGVDRLSFRTRLAIKRIDNREPDGFWTKPRNLDLCFKLPVAVALTLWHGGWYTVVLVTGGVLAFAFGRKSVAAPLSILPKV